MTSVTGVSTADNSPAAPGPSPLSGDGASTGRLGDRLFGGAARGAGLLVIILVVLIATFLLSQAIPAIAHDKANFLTSTDWNVDGDTLSFGIANLLWVTVISSVIALLIAVPLGVGVALFITQYSPRWLARPAASLVDLLAAVPSIVYGLWGLWVFGAHLSGIQHVLQDALGWFPLFSDTTVSEGGTIFVVGVVLAIMVLPIVTAISREVFAQTPVTHKEAALALGATRWEMIRTTVLPFGRPGVISASMLALGRALGETVAVLIILSALSGGTAWSWSIFNGGETFASKIANNAAEFDTPQKAGAFIAAGLVLFVLTFVVNALARIVIERRKAFTE
ncbi:phosphate ABC transporter permease subunit PstC [Oryzihumus leptocrescens]|uniref:Phosphate transport system permease protein n=1 Tax=Oryzihumus leptocrescens TaxID=297536 RepID=A0A542ZNB7_9MICO|nr:phosphate ABC transporter permease subunit PstC [Oryzihumus leptocrescens]TQL61843.1 phosphate ABC transporter membrane protein 1 (PhoT family) [Oryzihumus leptocrescens]